MYSLSLSAQSLWAKKSRKDTTLWLPLVMHLADSAAFAKKLWDIWVPVGTKQAIFSGLFEATEDDAQQLFVFLAASHDIGKATPVFQSKTAAYIPSDLDKCIDERIRAAGLALQSYRSFSLPNKTPHALATYFLLQRAGCDKRIASILGAHHGKPPDSVSLIHDGIGSYKENFHMGRAGETGWTAVQNELITFALNLAGYSSLAEIPKPNMAAQVLLSGLVIMTDWIVSNEACFPYICLEDLPNIASAQTRANSALKSMKFPFPWHADNTWARENLYDCRFGYTPKLEQTVAVNTAANIVNPGIFVLEAPMGMGKTEAALAVTEIFANKAKRSGVFFALPTQATSDGIFPRILLWVGKLDSELHSIKLVHGKAQFNKNYQALIEGSSNISEEDENGVFVHDWFEGKKKSLLADFVVGTIDQLLLAALKQKHVMLRHLGLANKVVIIDECHAYDAYMSEYLEMALRWLGAYGVPVIVLSATLPTEKRQAVVEAYLNQAQRRTESAIQVDPLGKGSLEQISPKPWAENRAYPLITYTDGSEIKQVPISSGQAEREVKLEFLDEGALVQKLNELLSDGGCAGVIVNTVGRAQELALLLREHFGEETVRLLHSRFLAPERAKKEQQLLQELGKHNGVTKRPKKCIVVGTQVMEQSLDIDFDVLISDLCPMDLLLQRIGRLHRHKRTRAPRLQTAFCHIIGTDCDGFLPGSKYIYGEYLLMRTRAFLPPKMILPQDIPVLVQDVYNFNLDLPQAPHGYLAAKEQWLRCIQDKEVRADQFRISQPWPNGSLNNWLNTDVPVSNARSEAAVRDIDESVEVLLIQKRSDGNLYFLPWAEDLRSFSRDVVPPAEDAKLLAQQSILLPHIMCNPQSIDNTIETLELENKAELPVWQQSPWLQGSLFLILDESCSVNLCGYHLNYDQFLGLTYEKEGD